MAQTNFNVGAIANDGTGEPLRQAFQEQQAMNTELYTTKVDKVVGKELSDNNYTDAEVVKLGGIEEGAEVNVQADWNQSDDTQDDYIKNKPEQIFSSVGYFHYADLATQTTPLSILSGINKVLDNDGDGAQTNTDQAPYGVSSVYDVLDNKFVFNQLSIGDTLNLRVDLSLTTTSANQKYLVFLRVGEGSDAQYDLPITNGQIKTASSDNRIVGNEPFSIDYQQHIDNPSVLFIVSDDNATVKVNGFFMNIVRKSVNIVEIEGGGAVDSVNGQTGIVVLDAEDVGAIPLTGTTTGNPITGDLEMLFDEGLGLVYKDTDVRFGFSIGDLPIMFYHSIVDNFLSLFRGSLESFFVNSDNPDFKGLEGGADYTANLTDLCYPQKIYVDSKIGNLHRQEFTFSGSQTFTLANNYGQVYSVEVQGQGALSTSQYTLVAPNQITINDTLDTADYVVVIYSNTVTGLQPYYSQAETDALITNNIKVWKSGINGVTVANTLTITPTYSQLIPANTFQAGDVVELDFRTTSPGAKTSASNNYVYLNTTSDLITGSPLQLAIYTSGATSRTIQLERRLAVKGATTRLVNPAGTLSSDIGVSGAMTSLTIDWTVDQYFIFAIGHTVADQTLTGDFYRIIKN